MYNYEKEKKSKKNPVVYTKDDVENLPKAENIYDQIITSGTIGSVPPSKELNEMMRDVILEMIENYFSAKIEYEMKEIFTTYKKDLIVLDESVLSKMFSPEFLPLVKVMLSDRFDLCANVKISIENKLSIYYDQYQ